MVVCAACVYCGSARRKKNKGVELAYGVKSQAQQVGAGGNYPVGRGDWGGPCTDLLSSAAAGIFLLIIILCANQNVQCGIFYIL